MISRGREYADGVLGENALFQGKFVFPFLPRTLSALPPYRLSTRREGTQRAAGSIMSTSSHEKSFDEEKSSAIVEEASVTEISKLDDGVNRSTGPFAKVSLVSREIGEMHLFFLEGLTRVACWGIRRVGMDWRGG